MVAPIRVLIVDHSVPARLGLRQILEQAIDIKVIGEAQDGTSALELVYSLRADVVVLESRLPDVCGMEVAAELRQRGHAMPILALSSNKADEYVRGMLQSGAAGYALKSEPSDKIVEAVRMVAAGGAWYSQNIAAKMADWIRNPPSVSGDLTMREVQVLELLRCGMTNQQIAAELSIVASTVRFHLRNVYIKLGVKRRGEAIAFAADQGIDAERLKETIAARLAFPRGRTSRKR